MTFEHLTRGAEQKKEDHWSGKFNEIDSDTIWDLVMWNILNLCGKSFEVRLPKNFLNSCWSDLVSCQAATDFSVREAV